MANFRAVAVKAAQQNGVDPRIFLAQIGKESGFNPNARSSSGAVGIAQIVPHWHPGVDATDPVASLYYAAHWMGQLVKKYGNYQQALSVYNSGDPNAYKDPHFADGQTYNYVKSIMGKTSPLAAPAPPPAGFQTGFATMPAVPAPALLANPLLSGLEGVGRQLGMPSIKWPTFHPMPLPAARGVSVPTMPLPLQRGAQVNVQPLSGKPSIGFIENFAKPFGLSVTSTTGGKHATDSYHYRQRAVDFGGTPNGMAALANYALAHAGDFTEMFYTGPGHPGFFISRGKVLPLSQLDHGLYVEHENHVHLAR